MSPDKLGMTPQMLLRLLSTQRRVWLYPMIGGVVLATILSLVLPRKWKATQGLLIRPEAAGLAGDRLGKFSDLSEMKTLQETILELARSQAVVTSVLESVGPAKGKTWRKGAPTLQDVADFREAMTMTPPGGAEFGKTEVFYLALADKSSKRAAKLVDCLSTELELRSNEIRDARARSMVEELAQGVAQAEQQLQPHLERLAAFESQIGPQLGDLRGLQNPQGGSNHTSQNLLAIEAELRANATQRNQNEKLLDVLAKAADDPDQLVATPSTLLTSQPALNSLKLGLIEAQLAKARLLGKLSPKHPLVAAAEEAEEQIRHQLHEELASATKGVEVELALSHQRESLLRSDLEEGRQKLAELASRRADYSRLVAAVEHHTQLVEHARARLADAQARLAGAQTSSLLARIDQVESSIRPIGPRRASIVAAGGLAGLLLGLGALYLMHAPAPVPASNRPTNAPTQASASASSNDSREVGKAPPVGTTPLFSPQIWSGASQPPTSHVSTS